MLMTLSEFCLERHTKGKKIMKYLNFFEGCEGGRKSKLVEAEMI